MYKRNYYQKFTIIVGANCVGLRAQQPLASYTYDDNGIRTSKTFGDTTTYYTNVDGAITSQYRLDEDGAVTDLMQFLYDGSNELLGFTYNGATYFYVKNLQGDVIAVIDSTGTEKAVYEYGAYGTLIHSQGDLADVNPMRYRGYYYDSDAGMYYLQSRYYAPEFAKFLNSDLPEYAQQQKADHYGTNLFAYCCNDPVNNVDYDGKVAKSISKKYTYVFVYNGSSSLVKQAKNSLYFNINDRNVKVNYLKKASEFKKKWNDMENADDVYLYLHGGYTNGKGALYFENGTLYCSDINGLKHKDITGSVMLFSCHGGDGDSKSVAYSFAKLTLSPVVALKVGVSYSKKNGKYYARTERKYYYRPGKRYCWWIVECKNGKYNELSMGVKKLDGH